MSDFVDQRFLQREAADGDGAVSTIGGGACEADSDGWSSSTAPFDHWSAPAADDAMLAGRASLFAGLYDSPTPGVDDVVPSGGGSALPEDVRSEMESKLGADFADVRIHVDNDRTNAMNAEAYTVGDDIVFAAGNFAPETREGKQRLAHELAHVVQQAQGAVDGTDVGGGVAVSDPSDPFERAAEETANRVVNGEHVVAAAGSASPGAASSVQRRTVQRKAGGGVGGICGKADDLYDKLPDGAKTWLDGMKDKVPGVVRDVAGTAKEQVCGVANAADYLRDTGKAAGKAVGQVALDGGGAGQAGTSVLDSLAESKGPLTGFGVAGKIMSGDGDETIKNMQEGKYGSTGKLMTLLADGMRKLDELNGFDKLDQAAAEQKARKELLTPEREQMQKEEAEQQAQNAVQATLDKQLGDAQAKPTEEQTEMQQDIETATANEAARDVAEQEAAADQQARSAVEATLDKELGDAQAKPSGDEQEADNDINRVVGAETAEEREDRKKREGETLPAETPQTAANDGEGAN